MLEIGLWSLVLLAIGATYLWRGVGVLLSTRVDPNGAFFGWVSAVTLAMLAGLVSRMIFQPYGALGETPMWMRLLGVAVAFCVFFGLGRRMMLAIGAGVLTFMACYAWLH